MHQIINDEILTIIRTILSNIEVQNKENGKDYIEDVKNPEGKEVIVEKEHEELYKDLISFRELFIYKNEDRNNYTYKNEEGKELGIYLPKIVDGEKKDVLGKITERFDEIESKFNKLTFTDSDKKQNIKKQLDNYKAILNEKNKIAIIENIATIENAGPEQEEAQTPTPVTEQRSTDRRKKVVKKESWLEKIENATIGRLDALTQEKAWADFKKNVGAKALRFGTRVLLPVAGAGSLLVIANQAIAAIGGVGTVLAVGGAASLLPVAGHLISAVGILGIAICSPIIARKLKKRKEEKEKERAEAEQEEKDFFAGQNNTQNNTQSQEQREALEEEIENIIAQENPQVTPNNPAVNEGPEATSNNISANEEPTVAANPPSQSMTEQDVIVQLRDKKQEVIDTKIAMEIEGQKDSSDPVVQVSQKLTKTQHEKSKHEFVKIILENIDVKELEQEETHGMTM